MKLAGLKFHSYEYLIKTRHKFRMSFVICIDNTEENTEKNIKTKIVFDQVIMND